MASRLFVCDDSGDTDELWDGSAGGPTAWLMELAARSPQLTMGPN